MTRVLQYEPDPLAYIDMPLAVADVYDRGYFPQDQLTTYVTWLKDAWVPPTQFVRVVRYAPAEPQFVPFVQSQFERGITGMALIAAIDQRVPQIRTAVVQPGYAQPGYIQPGYAQPGYVQPGYVQPGYAQPVYTQSGRRQSGYVAPGNIQTGAVQNPHGGPPGQLKRTYGYQTGAEVVHGGRKRGHQFQQTSPAVIAAPRQHGRGNGHGHGHGRGNAPSAVAVPQPAPVIVPHGHGNGNGGGKEHGRRRGHRLVAAPAPAPVVVSQPGSPGLPHAGSPPRAR